MALAIDSSTPAPATNIVGVTSLASNAVAPPGSSLLAILVAISKCSGATVSSITDSLASHLTYTKLVAEPGTGCQSEIWLADVPGTAPGSMTITPTFTSASDVEVLPIVFTGAQNSAAQITNANTGVAANVVGVAPTATTSKAVTAGSQVIGAFTNFNNNTAPTALSGQTATINGNATFMNDTNGGQGAWVEALSANSSGGSAVTLGASAPTTGFWAAAIAEILAASGGGVAIPPLRTQTNWAAVQRSLR
jgi:hypothetical protein